MKPRFYEIANLCLHPVAVGLPPHEVARVDGRLIVAHGELTGSRYAIVDRGARLFGPYGGPLLVVDAPVELLHEHDGELEKHTVAPGQYYVEHRESPTEVTRRGLVRLVRAAPEALSTATVARACAERLPILELSLGERAWIEGHDLRELETRRGDRIVVAESGGTFVHERNDIRTTIPVPRVPFSVVWCR